MLMLRFPNLMKNLTIHFIIIIFGNSECVWQPTSLTFTGWVNGWVNSKRMDEWTAREWMSEQQKNGWVNSKRMDEYRKAKRVLMAEVIGGWGQGKLKVGLGNRGMTVTGIAMNRWLSGNMLPNINTWKNGCSNFSVNLKIISE